MKTHSIVMIMLFFNTIVFAQHEYKLTGRVSNDEYNGKYVTLQKLRQGEELTSEQVQVKDGTFTFEGTAYLDDYALIELPNKWPYKLFLEEGNIEITIDSVSRRSGTPLNDQYQVYLDSCRYYRNLIENLTVYKTEEGNKNTFIVEIPYGSPLRKVYAQYENYMLNFKKQNMSNPVGRVVFLEGLYMEGYKYGTLDGVTMPKDSVFQVLYTLADDSIKQHPLIRKYLQRVADEKNRGIKD